MKIWSWLERLFVKKSTKKDSAGAEVPEQPKMEEVESFPAKEQGMRSINMAGLELIKHFEGFYPRPYLDPVGIPTIGIGTIAYENGKKVTLADAPITEQRALELLDFELNQKELIIDTFLTKRKIILNSNQFSALVSFCYNCGTGILTDPGRSLHQAVLSGHPQKVKDAWMLYNKGTKKILGVSKKVELPGLTRRRKAELDLYFS